MASHRPVEIELKLLVSPQVRAALEGAAALQPPHATLPEVRSERTVYFDTPGLGLARKGLSLRVRRSGEKRIQTLKSRQNGDGVATTRGEWEWPVEQDAPDLSRVADTPFAAEIAAEAASGLQPVFATDIRRTVRHLALSGGTAAEAAFDEGSVSAGEQARQISELEFELKQGAPGPLYRLALDLHRVAPFTIGTESKAERGQRLLTGEGPHSVETDPPPLDPRAPGLDAVRRIIGAGLGHVLANQTAASARDVEGVHQARVGIRRLRTALAMFGKHLEPHATTHFEAELKRLGRVFGQARDWDVFCTEVLALAATDERARPWTDALRDPAEALRQAAHRSVEDELQQPALTAFVLGMAAWIEPDEQGQVAMGHGKLDRPLAKLAPALLDRMARRAAKRGGHVKGGSAEELHDLRKALKKLRYSVEYLAGIYPEKRVKMYHKRAKHLLKLLGAGNDATMAATLGERLCEGRPELVPAAGALAEWSANCRDRAYRKLPKAWADFSDTAPFWH